MGDLPLVQWTFFQFKKTNAKTVAPLESFLHSATQIGKNILIYGGCDENGVAQKQLLLYDTVSYQWSTPVETSENLENHPGSRYGHSATLIEMHPPKIMIYGGMTSGGIFDFAIPDTPDDDHSGNSMERTLMSSRRKGINNNYLEEMDTAVYYLTLKGNKWEWTKPVMSSSVGKVACPPSRAEHSACKISSNEVMIFGGWTDRPVNDTWIFNFVDLEWRQGTISGIQPRPRFRHTSEVVQGKLIILGGSDNGDDVAEGSRNLGIHILTLETFAWSHPTLKGSSPFPRSGHSSAVFGSSSVGIFGGKFNNETFLNDFYLIDLDTFSTTRVNAVESLLPTPVANTSLTSIGNQCFVFGGTDVQDRAYNDLRLLDLSYYFESQDTAVVEGSVTEYSFKILIIGDAAVGKSSILTRFSENSFMDTYSTTIGPPTTFPHPITLPLSLAGIDFNSRLMRVSGSVCKLEIWDTAGQERFSSITANYYRGAQGGLLVYDISQRGSFESLQKWYTRAMQLGGEDLVLVLVGNKTDLPASRQVSTEEGEALARQLRVAFVETSALNGQGVERAFLRMAEGVKSVVDRKGLKGVKKESLVPSGGVQVAKDDRKKFMGCC